MENIFYLYKPSDAEWTERYSNFLERHTINSFDGVYFWISEGLRAYDKIEYEKGIKKELKDAFEIVRSGVGKMLKKWMVQVIAYMMTDFRNLSQILVRSDKEMTLIKKLVDSTFLTPSQVKKIIGKDPIESSRRSYYSSTPENAYDCIPSLAWLKVFSTSFDSYWYWGEKNNNYLFCIPPGLREAVIRSVNPDFKSYTPMNVSELPPDVHVYSGEGNLEKFSDFLYVSLESTGDDFLDKKAPIKLLKDVYASGALEPFPIDNADRSLNYAAATLAMVYVRSAFSFNSSQTADIKGLLRGWSFMERSDLPPFFLGALVPHLKGVTVNTVKNSKFYRVWARLKNLITASANVVGWMSVDNIVEYLLCQSDMDIRDLLLFNIPVLCDDRLKERENDQIIVPSMFEQWIIRQWIANLLMMFGAIGVLDLGFLRFDKMSRLESDIPEVGTLKYVRLTDAGRYAFGITDDINLSKSDAGPKVECDPSHGLIRLLPNGFSLRPLLTMMGKEVGVNLFKLDVDHMVRQAGTLTNLRSRIDDLKKLALDDNGKEWEPLFKEAERRFISMRCDYTQYRLISIQYNIQEIERLIAGSEAIREMVIPVAGRRLAVSVKDYDKVRAFFYENGYII